MTWHYKTHLFFACTMLITFYRYKYKKWFNVPRFSLLKPNGEYVFRANCHFLSASSRPILLAPAVTVGETEGAMDSASVLVFTSSFAYNFVRK